mmetsp:Transcript_14382/g.27742  ORF Transcript_14382/g.27742 Transcript_14382/m.27742 type:complete len:373 (+) Transcript_14382:205-1323(+)
MSEAKMESRGVASKTPPSTPTKKRSRKPPKPFSPNYVVTSKVSVSSAGKSCSQCGVTKTPQWREGPLGPKTLCNACGVKRVRAARAAMEGRMRMAKASKKTAAVGEMSTRRSTKGKSTAARAAAFILAAIEQKENEDDSVQQRTGSVARMARGNKRPASEAVEEQTTSHSDDTAEEIQFIPPKPPMSPITAAIGEGGVAALGLMSMSLPAEVVQRSINAQLEAHRKRSDGGKSEKVDDTSEVEQAGPKPEQEEKKEEEESNEVKAESSAECSTKSKAKATKRQRLEELQRNQQQLEDLQNAAAEAAKHAYAADAAVAAVAQVLAIKQAVALKARAEASAAAQRVHAASIAICKEEESPLASQASMPDKPTVL